MTAQQTAQQAADPAVEDIFADRRDEAAMAGSTPGVLRATDLTGVHVLKHDRLFMLSDAFGDIHRDRRGLGLYDGDTRVLSTYDLRLNGIRPVVLRAASAATYQAAIQLTNPDLVHSTAGGQDPEVVLRRQSLGILRERLVHGSFAERITVHNYTGAAEHARLALRLDADFADIFELRGLVRERRGRRLPIEGPKRADGGHRLRFAYRGLDGRSWQTTVHLSLPLEVAEHDGDGMLLDGDWRIPAGGDRVLEVHIWSEVSSARRRGSRAGRRPALPDPGEAAARYRAWRSGSAAIETSHLYAARALDRGLADLRLLLNSGPADDERYLAAGVPWFSCLFGRDTLITSLQLLAVRPQIAQETLAILARLQATEIDDWRDAEPGKILHELRSGELAATGEIPHTPYYGTVDATPLWLVLLDEYQRWTADDALVDRLWPHALAALQWIDEHGDLDGDGFVEYRRHSRRGLANQGWKDSADAIRMRDGRRAEAPIALVEVQGYVYAARIGLARLARLRGEEQLAKSQEQAAERLRVRFEEAFWMADAGTYALALDAEKRQVDAIASNAGHALWSGIASAERAAKVAEVLTGPGMWSGWGIRTLSSEMVGFNPIGYHLGTVWPHDNGICAAGFARYGLFDAARLVAGGLLESSAYFREARLPELFCGFDRESSPLPVPYPVACSPQAWAAGSIFHLVSSTLGMRPDAANQRLELVRPALPDWLPDLHIRNLRVGEALVDLAFGGETDSISVEVLRRSGALDVTVRL